MAQPTMDRAELTFDDVQKVLDAHKIDSWSSKEMGVLISLMSEYYKYKRTEAKQHQHHKEEAREGKNKGSSSCSSSSCEEDGEENSDDEEDDAEDGYPTEETVAEVDRGLTRIRGYLQRKYPFGSLQEPTVVPYAAPDTTSTMESTKSATESRSVSSNALLPPPVYSVDAFVYLEEDIEQLVENRSLAREYCRHCGAFADIGLTSFITHSFSQDQLVYLSCFLLPMLSRWGKRRIVSPGSNGKEEEEKTVVAFDCNSVVDVGSRLGIVQWACYLAAQQGMLTETTRVTGVELDEKFIGIQQELAKRFCSRPVELPSEDDKPRHLHVDVVKSNCFEGEGAEALKAADVIILHNVFEYFCKTEAEHLECWQRLRSLVSRRGQLLLCSPSIQETFAGFSEETFAAAGVIKKGRKRAREEENAKKDKCGEGGEKELHSDVRAWLTEYLEPIDVAEVAECFLAFRSITMQGGDDGVEELSSHPSASDSHDENEKQSSNDEDEEDDEGDDDHGHAHGGSCCGSSSGACCRPHGGACCGDENASEGCRDGEDEEDPLAELRESLQNIYVYVVR